MMSIIYLEELLTEWIQLDPNIKGGLSSACLNKHEHFNGFIIKTGVSLVTFGGGNPGGLLAQRVFGFLFPQKPSRVSKLKPCVFQSSHSLVFYLQNAWPY